ncbi:MAG TPA: LysM peptidoglycan-binding domain-containing protein [Planctomycetota bacterium]|nr:LysM peptidoglycan-binding domain-containing protein [Planctomycetota bacterium]
MSTKVKVGIAAVIVAALVALIVLDQKTVPTMDSRTGTPGSDGNVTVGNQPPILRDRDPAILNRDADLENLQNRANERFGTTRNAPAPNTPDTKVEKGKEPVVPGKEIKLPAEEYTVVENDSFEKIAKNRMGDGKYWTLIAQANPTVKAGGLRPGQKIVIPAKPEATKVEEPKKAEAKAEPVFQNKDGNRIYTVQAGDSLSAISVRVYNTSRYVEKIVDANRIADPSMLYVGMKLVMPDLPRRESVVAGAGTTPVVAPNTAGKKTHTVQPGENLWKIAARIAGDKGIEETMRSIVSLNPDKLKSIETAVRAGWALIVPE